MDLAANPYSPGSGLRPKVLSGREAEISAFDLMIARAKLHRPNRGMVLTGLRGVGKTVLLNVLRAHADNHGWLTVQLEGRPEARGRQDVRDRFARELVVAARRHLGRHPGQFFADALTTIQSFSVSVGTSGVSASVDLHPVRAQSGRIDIDVEELVEDLSEPLKAQRSAFGLFIDEMQDLDPDMMSAIVTVQHIAGQRDWPFYVICAGLPNLPTILSATRSYAERLFDYRVIGPLDPEQARYAVARPAKDVGAEFDTEALNAIVAASGGYPYFIQEFGKAVWEVAPTTPFTVEDSRVAIEKGWAQLDSGFFPARWGRATPKEREYMSVMAVDGAGPSRTGELAARLGTKASSLGPTRAQLIQKGMIYAPDHGQVAFTVPGMAGFIARQSRE